MKQVVLIVCGGIAAYKVPNIIRHLVKESFKVTVIMTQSSEKFVSKLVLENVSGRPVICDTDFMRADMPHLSVVRHVDAMVVIPATANFIAKTASGMADDVATTSFLACQAPKLMLPAMHTEMYKNPITQQNIHALTSHGVRFLGPIEGPLSSGDYGQGRLLDDLETITYGIQSLAVNLNGWKGKKIIVTGGGTSEAIDDVRVLTNRSTGSFARAISNVLIAAGASVTYIGPRSTFGSNPLIQWVDANKVEDMRQELLVQMPNAEWLFMAAAISDYTVKGNKGKIKKTSMNTLALTLTPDILTEMTSMFKSHAKIIGFCCEATHLIESAKKKCKAKNCDYIVANSTSAIGNNSRSFMLLNNTGKIELEVTDETPARAAQQLIHHLSQSI